MAGTPQFFFFCLIQPEKTIINNNINVAINFFFSRTAERMEGFEADASCPKQLAQSSSIENEDKGEEKVKADKVVGTGDTGPDKDDDDDGDIAALSDSAATSSTMNADDTGIYRYIKDDLFTSEIYKVEIQNLPKYTGFSDLKKFLAKYRLNPHKIKLIQKQTFAFVTFKSEEERNKAMKVIHGAMWKSRALSVRLAKPKADPIMKKRKREDDDKEQPESKRHAAQESAQEEPLSKQIADVVTPLWQVPYEEQLKMKEQECEHLLQRLTK